MKFMEFYFKPNLETFFKFKQPLTNKLKKLIINNNTTSKLVRLMIYYQCHFVDQVVLVLGVKSVVFCVQHIKIILKTMATLISNGLQKIGMKNVQN